MACPVKPGAGSAKNLKNPTASIRQYQIEPFAQQHRVFGEDHAQVGPANRQTQAPLADRPPSGYSRHMLEEPSKETP